ncbi:MAG TPA: hypothetical protein VFM54_21265 [Micromonosporaceae bacterium]|nr:hypothetical protein [Micromonosporaceae bacterium]
MTGPTDKTGHTDGTGPEPPPQEPGSADGGSRAGHWGEVLVASLRLAAPAIAGYALLRLFGVLFLWLWARQRGQDVWWLLGERWDSSWYIGIAENGYHQSIPVGPDGEPITTNLAFFPVYPTLMRALAAVLPISVPTAGLVITWTASLVAAWGIFMVGHHLYGRRAGIVLALLWGVLPHAVVQSMGYTEALFTAVASWTLYALLTRRWLTAGALCVLAGLTRPNAAALIAAIGLAAMVAIWRRQDGWRPWVGAAIAPLGWLGFLAWVGYRLNRIDGWFYVQGDIWGSSFDGGRYTIRTLNAVLTEEKVMFVPYVVAGVLAVVAVLLVLGVLDRQPWPLLLYSTLVVVTTVGGTGYFHTNPRHMLPAFTLLLPVAAAAVRMRLRSLVAIISLLAVASAWFGGYLALLWRFSP